MRAIRDHERAILNEHGVDVHFEIIQEENGDGYLTQSHPEKKEIDRVLFHGVDIIDFLSDNQLETLKEQIS